MSSRLEHTLRQALCALLVVLAALATAPAAAQTWTGAGPNDNWSTGANWSGGVAPASGPTTQVTFPNSPRTSPVVDLPWTVNRITLEVAYSLSGQPITLAGANPVIEVSVRAFIANPITLTGPASFFTLQTLDVTGAIGGTGPLNLSAVGGILLAGANTYTGGTTIGPGAVALQGSMLGPVTVATVGSLRGSNGTVNGPVVVNLNGTIGGTLTTGDLAIAGFASMAVNGSGPGQYDTIRVNGTVTLTNATLSLGGSYVPVAGDVFTLIDNDGTDPVVGTFAGLPEGATLTFNGVVLGISYRGGTGNDVTLRPLFLGPAHGTPTLSQWALVLLASIVLAMGLRARAGRSTRRTAGGSETGP